MFSVGYVEIKTACVGVIFFVRAQPQEKRRSKKKKEEEWNMTIRCSDGQFIRRSCPHLLRTFLIKTRTQLDSKQIPFHPPNHLHCSAQTRSSNGFVGAFATSHAVKLERSESSVRFGAVRDLSNHVHVY